MMRIVGIGLILASGAYAASHHFLGWFRSRYYGFDTMLICAIVALVGMVIIITTPKIRY